MLAERYSGNLLEHIRAFTELATRVDRGNNGAYFDAARALGLDVSVLRRRMQTLAAWIGRPLFDGRGTSMRVTFEGAALMATAKRIDEEIDALRHVERPPLLRLGCTGTITTELMPGVLASMQRAHPRLVVQIIRAGADLALRSIADKTLDFAVVRASTAPSGVTSRLLARDRLWVAVPKGHELARGSLAPARLAKFPMVTYRPTSATRIRVMETLAPLGGSASIEVDGKEAALRFVEAKSGIAFVSLLGDHTVTRRGVLLREVTRHFRRASFLLVHSPRTLGIWESDFVRLMVARMHGRA
jgi:DNA-binding transcriptional LysR family regulator